MNEGNQPLVTQEVETPTGSLLGTDTTEATGTPLGGAEEAKSNTTDGDGAVPEVYEFEPPDNFAIHQDDLKKYQDIAREAKLTQAQFEAVTKHGIDYLQREIAQREEAQAQQHVAWQAEVLDNREFGDGKSLHPAVRQNVARVIDTYGGDALKEALNATGAGNHPAIVKLFNDIGKSMDAAMNPDKGKPVKNFESNQPFGHLAKLLDKGPSDNG